MADTKTTALTANTAPLTTDLLYMVDDPGGSALSQKITFAYAREILSGVAPTGRLTLTTAVPVTTADVTAAGTLYYTPYIGDLITLYDGTSWRTVSYTEKSLSLVGYTASKPYDIWGYLSSGTLALESTVWTDATTRATALAYQDGRLVKNGTVTRLYLGTIYINSSGAQTDDAAAKRNVFNYYNRRLRRFYKYDATSHTYGTATWRSWNNDATQRIEIFTGVIEDTISFNLWTNVSVGAATRRPNVSFAVDATNTYYNSGVSDLTGVLQNTVDVTSARYGLAVTHQPTLGFHYYQITENAADGANSTFAAAGLQGFCMA